MYGVTHPSRVIYELGASQLVTRTQPRADSALGQPLDLGVTDTDLESQGAGAFASDQQS